MLIWYASRILLNLQTKGGIMRIDTAITDEALPVYGSGQTASENGEENGSKVAVDLPVAAGARVVFTGCVRDHDHGQKVTHLVYQAHPQAEEFLDKAVREAVEGLPIEGVWVRHRVGRLELGEVALLVIVDSAHRAEAFTATARVVDEIKAQVPIWKDQYFADGTHSWSECP